MVKQEDRRATTRAAVLDVARKLFGEGGFTATSVDEIAVKAGVAKGAVFHHFATKALLFEAVLEGVSAQILAGVVSATDGITDYWTAIETGNRAFFIACADEQVSRIFLHDGPAVVGWNKWREIDHRNFGGLLVQAITFGVGAKIIAIDDPKTMANLVQGAVTEAVLAASSGSRYEEDAQRYVALITLMMKGWSNPS